PYLREAPEGETIYISRAILTTDCVHTPQLDTSSCKHAGYYYLQCAAYIPGRTSQEPATLLTKQTREATDNT
ncbi:hypothetical protein Tdes44962_MAKER07989, partial [Teratosphaeria destructans]